MDLTELMEIKSINYFKAFSVCFFRKHGMIYLHR